jgi:hypothetical protein
MDIMIIEKHTHTDNESTLKFLRRARKDNKGQYYGIEIETPNGTHSIRVHDTSIIVQVTPFGDHGASWDMSVGDLYETIIAPLS